MNPKQLPIYKDIWSFCVSSCKIIPRFAHATLKLIWVICMAECPNWSNRSKQRLLLTVLRLRSLKKEVRPVLSHLSWLWEAVVRSETMVTIRRQEQTMTGGLRKLLMPKYDKEICLNKSSLFPHIWWTLLESFLFLFSTKLACSHMSLCFGVFYV